MIIVAGQLRVEPDDREEYLAAVGAVTRLARGAPGCLDFVQAADPLDPARINIYERWIDDQHLEAFRNSGGPETPVPPVRSADVRKYRIASEEAP